MTSFKSLTNSCLLLFLSLFATACSSFPEAEEMGQKWCSCNETMGSLYTEMNASEEQQKKDALSVKILAEQANVLQCMGGEEKLKALNEQFSGTDFQKHYDQTRLKNCPALVQLLSKKE